VNFSRERLAPIDDVNKVFEIVAEEFAIPSSLKRLQFRGNKIGVGNLSSII